MLRKVLTIVSIVVISVFCLTGCKKKSEPAESEAEATKTTAEYEAEAKKEITKENMAAELEQIEKAVEEEISEGQ
jgi:PBP1b-binding outer membrane lipoprotein LpoB